MERFTHITNTDLLRLIEERRAGKEYLGIWLPEENNEALYEFAANEKNEIYGIFQIDQMPNSISLDYYFLYRRLVPVTKDNISGDSEKKGGIFEDIYKMVSASRYLCGIINDKAEEIVPLEYLDLVPFMNDILLIRSCHGSCLWGLIRMTGETLVEPMYDRIDPPSESLFAICKNKRVGFMNFKGEIEIPMEYDMDDSPSYFSNGLACMAKSFMATPGIASSLYYGYINHKNETVIPFQFHKKVDFDTSCVISNTKKVNQEYGYTFESYKLCIDGTVVMYKCDDTHLFDYY